jgi:FtsH-binding integral membrane protein
MLFHNAPGRSVISTAFKAALVVVVVLETGAKAAAEPAKARRAVDVAIFIVIYFVVVLIFLVFKRDCARDTIVLSRSNRSE